MSDVRPNCAITLYFYAGDPKEGIAPRFAYYCSSSSQGWHVQPDGSIHPPSRSRIIEINLNYFATELERPLRFAGLQMVETNYFPKRASYWPSKKELNRLGVKILTPGYPTGKSSTWRTFGPLTFDFTNAKSRVFYQLAVAIGDDEPTWDDPKIYDDGSQ